jgi:hypothetical protein
MTAFFLPGAAAAPGKGASRSDAQPAKRKSNFYLVAAKPGRSRCAAPRNCQFAIGLI